MSCWTGKDTLIISSPGAWNHSMHSGYTCETRLAFMWHHLPCRNRLYNHENILTELRQKKVEDDATRFAIWITSWWLPGIMSLRQTPFAAVNLSMPFTKHFKQRWYGIQWKWTTLCRAQQKNTMVFQKMTTLEIQYEWALDSSLYYNYYVFQYSTVCSSFFQPWGWKLFKWTQEDVINIFPLLESGNSYHSLNAIRKAGVDMEKKTIWTQPLRLERRLNEFESSRKLKTRIRCRVLKCNHNMRRPVVKDDGLYAHASKTGRCLGEKVRPFARKENIPIIRMKWLFLDFYPASFPQKKNPWNCDLHGSSTLALLKMPLIINTTIGSEWRDDWLSC